MTTPTPIISSPKPLNNVDSQYLGFDHIHLWVANAKQAAEWYILRFGFSKIAYRGLETGSREIVTHVLKQNNIIIAISSPLTPLPSQIADRIAVTGDAVKDVAFTVKNVRAVYDAAIAAGAKSVLEPVVLKDEQNNNDGEVIIATIQTYGDTTHTLVERGNYKGVFLPGYRAVEETDPLAVLLPSPHLGYIDHVVGNQPDDEMIPAVEWYEKMLGFHRFWSVDDKMIHTEYSSLRSIVMADPSEVVKMPINEPAAGKKKSQIKEYVEYHGGAGVQHIALNVHDIIPALENLKARGLTFLSVPKSYYDDVRVRLGKSSVQVAEDLDTIERLNLLIDFDDTGYLLQIFTKPVEDRPTLFYEIIQRRGHQGFGAGNFKALFESIEREQAIRGNLENDSSVGDARALPTTSSI
jgi:4-hydroxyphenylpyruvate dioxygenase